MSTILGTNNMVNPGDLTLNTATNPGLQLGSRVFDQSGNAYRFCQVGATALAAGKLYQASAQVAAHQNVAVTTAAIGATSVTVALGATAATANQYAGGWIVITAGTGLATRYLISSHPAAALSTSLVLTLSDPLAVATLTSDSKADLIANPYSAVIVDPAAASSSPVGVSGNTLVAGLSFGWLQTQGVANCLADGAITVGTALAASNGTAGAVEPLAGVQAAVATAVTDISTTEYGAINVDLA